MPAIMSSERIKDMESDKSNVRDLIFLVPEFHGKLWGGRRLEEEYGYDLPDGPVGECWAISAHPHGDCKVAGGAWDGQTLSALWAEHRELFGGAEGDEFPLDFETFCNSITPAVLNSWNEKVSSEAEKKSMRKA